jgi:serine/threonine protein kinase
MAEAPLPPELDAAFAVEGTQGSGAFGRVLKATRRSDGRVVALKLLHATMRSEETRRRFDREARATAALDHRHIVEVLDSGVTEDGIAYIVYEFVAGEPLGNLRDPTRLATLGAALADALQAIHDAGLVHRDVKPENILVRPDGSPVLCDLGVARSTREGTVATATGILLGTPGYMAPELWWGVAASPASDQWALAATLFEAWAGRGVYPDGDLAAVRDAANSGEVPPIPPGANGLTPPWASALERALAPRPEDRFPTCRELGAALRAPVLDSALAEASTPTTPRTSRDKPAEPGPPGSSRKRLMALGLGVAACLALGWAVGGHPGAPPPTPSPSPTPPPTRPVVPEAVQQARVELEDALARLRQDLPPFPETDPEFRAPATLQEYLDTPSRPDGPTRAEVMVQGPFLDAWHRVGQNLASWLAAVARWHREAGDDVAVVDRPGVRRTLVQVGAREFRHHQELIAYVLTPVGHVMRSLTIQQRALLATQRSSEYTAPMNWIREELSREPFRDEPLAIALDTIVPRDWDQASAGRGALELAARLGDGPLDTDRAWLMVAALRSLAIHRKPDVEHCRAFQELVGRAATMMDGDLSRLDALAPRVVELHTSVATCAWFLSWTPQCGAEAFTEEVAGALDRTLAWLRSTGVAREPEIVRRWARWILADGVNSPRSLRAIRPAPIEARRPEVQRIEQIAGSLLGDG